MYSWKRYFVVQADYQSWANNTLLDSLAHLKPDALEQDEGLFFKSIHHTLDHMLAVGRLWLGRLQGDDPEINVREMHYPVWRELQNAVRRETRQLQEWLEKQPEEFFESEVLIRGDGKPANMWVRDVFTHIFTHYAHHRGQISAVATRLGAPCPRLDYAVYRREMEKLLEEARQTPR